MKTSRVERGQALVLIVLAIVAIFGFAALSVDVGRVLAERRHAQGAADSAAMAAAFSSTGAGQPGMTGDPVVALTDALAENEYVGWTFFQNSTLTSTDRLVVHYNHPPLSGPYISNTEYYQVIIDVQVDQVFSQFVYKGPLRVSVESVARAMPTGPVTGGFGLVANGFDHCPGIVWNGTMNTTLIGGGIYSNSNGHGTSGTATPTGGTGECYSGIVTGGSGSISVPDGSINLVGGWRNNAGASVNPTPVVNSPAFALPLIPKPDCSRFGAGVKDTATNTFNPGNYPSGISINSGVWRFEPGMYCLGGNFTINGGIVTGEDVMFVQNGGGINFSGRATITLLRAHVIEDSVGQQFGGMLIYMPVENKDGVDINGASGTTFAGTIYAPGPRDPDSQEKCNIGGNASTGTSGGSGGGGHSPTPTPEPGGDISLTSNIICYSIGIAGKSNVSITYDPKLNYQMQPRVELAQ